MSLVNHVCRNSCLSIATLALASCSSEPGTKDAGRLVRPNIVLILADDLGWSDLGCYGGEIPTPNIDKLAANGLVFTQFYNNSICGPTRASLLTGLYAQRIGHSGTKWDQATDFTRSITLGEGLQLAGYHTMMVGKWQDPELPATRGFDRFFGPLCDGKISYFDEVVPNPFFLDTQRVKIPPQFYLTDALTDYAVRFLKDAESSPELNNKPFFLYVAHFAPHWPLHAREADINPHRNRYRECGWDEWRSRRFEKQRELGLIPASWQLSSNPDNVHPWEEDSLKDWQAERMSVYAAQVASIDKSTGLILDALRKSGKIENTLIIVLSDNGAAPDGGLVPADVGFFSPSEPPEEWLLNGREMRIPSGPDNLPGPRETFQAYGLAWALMSNTPFRDTKLTGYEGGIRTPLIAHWPAGILTQGRIINEIGHVMDLMPTFLELAGGTYPAELAGRTPLPLDGYSLASVLQGESSSTHEYLAWNVPQNRVLRSGDWKIISKDNNTPWELYDLSSDGSETKNLADQHPDIVKRLADKWLAWAKSCNLL
ncbi:MAG: arylsulfatase [Bacteroidales bacterium]|nr:arylsulfatase [Bacteroidales bacterium]